MEILGRETGRTDFKEIEDSGGRGWHVWGVMVVVVVRFGDGLGEL